MTEYTVFFKTFHGSGQPVARPHKAQVTDNLEDAIQTAKNCYGWVEEEGRKIKDFSIS